MNSSTKSFASTVHPAGDKVSLFGESVDYYPDRVVFIRPGEPHYEVHTDVLPGSIWGWEWSEDTKGGMLRGVGALVGVTVLHKLVYVLSCLPPVVLLL